MNQSAWESGSIRESDGLALIGEIGPSFVRSVYELASSMGLTVQEESVTQWIRALKGGDSAAAAAIWERYIATVIRLVQSKLPTNVRRMADEEDVAVDVFEAFLRGVRSGRFLKLNDRDDLWQILAMITERKAADQLRREFAAKRGAGNVQGESGFFPAFNADAANLNGINQVVGAEPTPEFAAHLADYCRKLMAILNDSELQKIVRQKMEGYTND